MPKLSIITVNLNNKAGLQKTMESVFAQTFTDYEYIIIDGGSTDGSKELIEKHQNKFACAVSEKDGGIYNGMNKGILRATGEYLLFLNSGDLLYSNVSLNLCNDQFEEDIVYANILVETTDSSWVKTYPPILTFTYFLTDTLPHPASLIKRTLFAKCGLFNEQNKVVSDWQFFMDAVCLHNATYKYFDYVFSVFKYDGISSKIENQILIQEEKDFILNKSYSALLSDYRKAAEIKRALEKIKTEQEKTVQINKRSRVNRFFRY